MYVCLAVCLSLCHEPVLCQNEESDTVLVVISSLPDSPKILVF